MRTSVLLWALGVSVLASFAQGCEDNDSRCAGYAQRNFCKMGSLVPWMKKNCKKSCNICDGGGTGGGSGGSGGSGGTGGSGGSGGTVAPGQCGFKPNARIVGGTEAPQGAWPWHAMLRIAFNGLPFCGGTLVHPNWVITAAHCVRSRGPKDVIVRLGAHRRKGKVGTEQDIKVTKVLLHESYRKPYGIAHDIALLKLERPAQINGAVGRACLPSSSGSVADGKHCWVTGFGRLSSNGNRPTVLMQVSVPIVNQAKCTQAYGSKLIHDSMVCAGLDEGGKDSCQGDSGGPLVCEAGGKFYLEGVVSWGKGCAVAKQYGVYARVRYLRQWVDKKMSSN